MPQRDLPSAVKMLIKNIRREMKKQGITGNKLAVLIKRPVMTVNDMLNCRTIPGSDLLFEIADVLGKGVDELRGKQARKKSA